MARTVRNAKLDTRSARTKLAPRREPYWIVVSAGCALGYRKGAKGGTWIARFREPTGGQRYEAIGAADDARDADGVSALSCAQAQDRARAFFAKAARVSAGLSLHQGPYRVADALSDYFEARRRKGSRGVSGEQSVAAARILPELGQIDAATLTTRRIRDWHTDLAHAAKMVRSKRAAVSPATKAVDSHDADAVRARRSTANRILTILKAALNHAFREGALPSDEQWRKVKPFREVDSPIVQFLKPDECVRLVNVCEDAFRDLVRAALLTGCRYGELSRLRVSDFNADAYTISVQVSKSGKPRHVALTEEGREHFLQMTIGRRPRDLIFARPDGASWKQSQQQRPLAEASERAKIDPPVTFHILRHTYASTLAMNGAPMGVIAAQLGHADTRITERHYAHLAPSFVADTVRATLPKFGIVDKMAAVVRIDSKTPNK